MPIKDLEKRREYQRIYNANRPPEDKEKHRERGKQWYKKNKEKRKLWAAKYRREHREELRQRRMEGGAIKERNSKLKRNHSISINQYENLLIQQGNKCAICGKSPSGKHFAVDHNHQTGKIRGLLCNNCNAGIGLLGDNHKCLVRAAKYVQIGTCGNGT